MEDKFLRKIDVLDKGFVRLVKYMASDEDIVQAARVSYGSGTKTIMEDRGLIRYLIRHRHTTPLEMCEFKFHIKIPADSWRQMVRHRTASVNEYSTRYSIAINDKQQTPHDQWRLQAKNNKQGSSGVIEDVEKGVWLTSREEELHKLAKEIYQERLNAGVAREQARKDLPLSNYTEAYWKMDLHNLLHYLKLRMDPHAQLEIRQYANAIYELIKPIVPLACEAFEDYVLNAVTFSKSEMDLILSALHREGEEDLWAYINEELGHSEYGLSKRELNELKSKLSVDQTQLDK